MSFFIILIITVYLPSRQINDLIKETSFPPPKILKKQIPSVVPLTDWLPIVGGGEWGSLGQVAGLIVMKISVMLK